MTKEIPLTQGKVTLVDDDDYPELSKFKWYAQRVGKNRFYASRNYSKDGGKRTVIRMHAIIIGTPKGMDTDHINGNGLDNRRENLRVVTRRVNMQNLHIPKTSRYPGVSWSEREQKWISQIYIGEVRCFRERFNDEEQAALRYRTACGQIVT